MIFQVTEDGGLTNIFKELKSVKTTFEELDKTTLRSAINAFNNTSISVDDLSQNFGGLDDSVVTYLNSTERGQASINGLSNSMYNSAASMSFAATKAKLLAGALEMITGIAITLAIQGIIWVIDELIVTMDEQKEKLDDAVQAYEESETELKNINDELKTTQERIDELNSKDNLTFTEQDELEKLIKTNDELERKIFLLEQANKEAEKKVVAEAQETYDKYTKNRNIGAVDQIDFYTNSSLLEGVSWDTYKDDLSWLIAQYKKQEEVLSNAQANGWTDIEENARNNLELLEGYMSEASQDYQDLYDKIGGISEYAMTDKLKEEQQDLNNILDITAEILGYGGERAEISFDDIWNSEDFSSYKIELENLAKEGKLDASVLESNENYRKLLENTGATAEDTAQHINALVDEMKQLPDTASDFSNQTSILTLDEAKIKIEGDDENDIGGIKDELELLQEVIADTGNVSIETYEKLLSYSPKYATALKNEAGKIVVDTKKLQALNKTRVNAVKTEVKEASTLKKLQWINEAKKILQYRKQQTGLTDNIWETCDGLQEEINKFDILAQGIDAASNAFTDFQNAQNATESGDYFDIGLEMANEIQKGLESGKVGTPEFLAAIKGAMTEDMYSSIMAMGDGKEQKEAIRKWYEDVYSQYFIEGEGAEYDISGLENFAKKVDELGYGTYEKLKDGSFNFELNEYSDLEKLAQEMQLNSEQVYAILGEFDEYDLGEMFDISSKNYIDDYYDDLNRLTQAQEAYNDAVESGDKNKQALAYKELTEAAEQYESNMSTLAERFSGYKESYDQSDSEGSFADYLLSRHSEEELLLMFDNIEQRALDVRARMKQLSQSGDRDSEEYKQLSEELKSLKESQDIIDDIIGNTESLDNQTKNVVNNFKKYQKLVEKIQNEDMGKEQLELAVQQATNLLATLGELPAELRLEIQSNIQEIDAKITSLSTDISNLQKSKSKASTPQVQFAYQHAINQKQNQINSLTEQKVELEGILNFDTESAKEQLQSFQADMDGINDKNVTVSVTNNASSQISSIGSELDKLPSSKTILINIRKNGSLSGLGDSSATVNSDVNGTFNSFATGTARNVSIQNDQEAVVNELGEEGLIRNGKLIPIKGGVQLLKLKKNDIILNHKQMASLKKNGHAVGRGKLIGSAYFNGTLDGISAFYDGNYGGGGGNIGGTKTKTGSTRDSLDDVEDVIDETTEDIEEATKEVFDWIERRIAKLQRLTDKWIKNAETALTSGFITKYFNKAAKTLNKELKVQEQAFHRYQAEADKSGLSDKWKKKVNDGLVDIETITDETLAEQINEYMQWHDKSIACLEAFATAAEQRFNIPLEKATAKIEKFNEAIDLLDAKLENAIGATNKNKLVNQETKNQRKILNAQKTAAKNTASNLKKQSKAMISSSILKGDDVSKADKKKIKKAVKNGSQIDLALFADGSAAYNAAVKYNEALKANEQATYDLALAQEEYNSWLVEAAKIKFDNVAQDYENKIQMLEYQMESFDRKIAETEAISNKINRQYYESQKKINTSQLTTYQEELKALEKRLSTIKEGTEEWYEAKDTIEQIKQAISDCTIETAELNQAINQLYFDAHDNIKSDIERIIAEQEMLTSLFSHEKNADSETGTFTEAGIANLGSKVAIYELAQSKANETERMVKDLQHMVDNNLLTYGEYTFNSIEELENKLKEFYTEWQDDIAATYQAQVEIVDLMTEKYQAELEMVQQLINDKKEALQAEKDLHDYQKKIQEKTSNINTLQRQIAAYGNDSSQEGMAKLQQLTSQLNEAKDDLEETEYERYLSDQESMLDELSTEYEELITKKLEDFMSLVKEGIETANNNLSSIETYLSQVAENNDYIEETTGLFNGVTNSIDTAVTKIVAAISDQNAVIDEDVSSTDTSSQSSQENGNVDTNSKTDYSKYSQIIADNQAQSNNLTTQLAAINAQLSQKNLSTKQKATLEKQRTKLTSQLNAKNNEIYQMQLELAEKYVNENLSKATKAKSEYSDVNKKLYAKFGGKVLSSAELKELASLLGITYNNAKSTGNLYKTLKQISFPGFSKGGTVVSVDDINKRIKDNGDDALASVKVGESILTPVDSANLAALVDTFSSEMIKDFTILPKALNQLTSVQRSNNIDYGGVSFNFELSNVADANEFVSAIQNSKKLQKAIQSVSVDRMNGGGRLDVKSIR